MVGRQVPLDEDGVGRVVVCFACARACGVLATPRGLVPWLARRPMPAGMVFDVVYDIGRPWSRVVLASVADLGVVLLCIKCLVCKKLYVSTQCQHAACTA